MSLFVTTIMQCSKCGKEYEGCTGLENWSIVSKSTISPFCKKCSKELKAIVNKWINKKTCKKPKKK